MIESILSIMGIGYLTGVFFSIGIGLTAITYLSYKIYTKLLGFLNQIFSQAS